MKPINTLLFCFLLPAGLLWATPAITMKDVANARCDERCKLKDYQGGSYLADNKCICTDTLSFVDPIIKIGSVRGKAVITQAPPTIVRVEW